MDKPLKTVKVIAKKSIEQYNAGIAKKTTVIFLDNGTIVNGNYGNEIPIPDSTLQEVIDKEKRGIRYEITKLQERIKVYEEKLKAWSVFSISPTDKKNKKLQ